MITYENVNEEALIDYLADIALSKKLKTDVTYYL